MKKISSNLKKLKITFNQLSFILVISTIFLGIINFFYLYNLTSLDNLVKKFPNWLITASVLNVLIICFYFAVKARKLFIIKNKDLFTFKFHTKIILFFSTICILPIFIVLIFSTYFFHFSSKSWFNGIVDHALNESLAISELYIEEQQQEIIDDLYHIKKHVEKNTTRILLEPEEFDKNFSGKAATLSLTEAVIFVYNSDNNKIKIIAKTAFSFFPSVENFDFTAQFKPNALGYGVILGADDNYIRSIVEVSTMPNTYIMVGRLISDKIIGHVKNAQDANSNYLKLKSNIGKVKSQSIIIFCIVIILIILSVILLAFNYSAKIFRPLVDMILAIRKVSQGKYNIKIKTSSKSEEIGVLVRSFNHMVKLLGQKNSDLNLSNHIITAKKQFLEVVLGNMPAAIFVLDVNKKIKLFNKSAKSMFKNRTLNNADLLIIFPELGKLIDKLHESPDGYVKQELKAKIMGEDRVLSVYISIEKSEGEINGYIVNML
jgi:two-component system nitrogen regulation sensor histidine kinase NtrY